MALVQEKRKETDQLCGKERAMPFKGLWFARQSSADERLAAACSFTRNKRQNTRKFLQLLADDLNDLLHQCWRLACASRGLQTGVVPRIHRFQTQSVGSSCAAKHLGTHAFPKDGAVLRRSWPSGVPNCSSKFLPNGDTTTCRDK